MINGRNRTIKQCECGKIIKDRATIIKHRKMGHEIEAVTDEKNYIFTKKVIETMKYASLAALIGIIVILSSSVALAQETKGTCIDNDNILYNTSFTVNGQAYEITDTERCTSGCQRGLDTYGDKCAPTNNDIAPIPFALWLFCLGLTIWFWRIYRTPLVPTTLLMIVGLAGTLISQHVLMYIPLGITVAIWVWNLKKIFWKSGVD